MGDPRWQRIRECFDGAVELPTSHRDEYLRRVCGADAALRKEVEELLACDGRAAGFLRDDATDPYVPGADGLSGAPGDRVGSYRLVRPIASGGMGAVWLAERADEQFQSLAAIKLVRAELVREGSGGPESVRRFVQERQVLADLRHPNISRLLDGGLTEHGRPYLVMEYVEGLPIDEHCERYGLGLADRLRIMREVCGAVQYAHQNLIVHRDLKPNNILVNKEGAPILLDFGIAKLLSPGGVQRGEVTEIGQGPMTPGYASPEQIQGKGITTGSDVYSLGVLLYRLLTRRGPYRLATDSYGELERAVCEQEPAAPSAGIPEGGDEIPNCGLGARGLRRALRGDLDTITLMALRKDPLRRYVSAEQLSDDLRRHLEGLPVIARPDTLGYRARKFVRRHRVGVGLGSTVAALLVTLTVATKVQSSRLAEQRAVVMERARQTQEVAEFQAAMLGELDAHWLGRVMQEEQRRQVEAGLGFRPVVENGSSRTRTREEIDSELRQLDEALGPGNATDAARRVLDETILKPGIEAARKRFAGQPDVEAKLHLTIGQVYMNLGMIYEAERQFRRALELRGGMDAEGDVGGDAELATTLQCLGEVVKQRRDYDGAQVLHERAIEIRTRMFGPQSVAVAQSLNDLGLVCYHRGDLDGAETRYRRALEIVRGHGDEAAEDRARILSNLAGLLMWRRDLAAAEPLLREALEIYRASGKIANIALSLNNLAGLLHEKGEDAGAEPLLREAMQMRSERLGDDHPVTINSMSNLAAIVAKLGRDGEALSLAERALAGRLKSWPAGHPLITTSRVQVAELLMRLGRDGEAESLLLAAWAGAESDPGTSVEIRGKVLRRLVELYELRGQGDRAAEYRGAVERLEKALGGG